MASYTSHMRCMQCTLCLICLKQTSNFIFCLRHKMLCGVRRTISKVFAVYVIHPILHTSNLNAFFFSQYTPCIWALCEPYIWSGYEAIFCSLFPAGLSVCRQIWLMMFTSSVSLTLSLSPLLSLSLSLWLSGSVDLIGSQVSADKSQVLKSAEAQVGPNPFQPKYPKGDESQVWRWPASRERTVKWGQRTVKWGQSAQTLGPHLTVYVHDVVYHCPCQ